jgi:hypothetical protein
LQHLSHEKAFLAKEEKKKKNEKLSNFFFSSNQVTKKKLLEGKVLYAFAYNVATCVFRVFFSINNFSFFSFLFFLTLQREAEINEGSFIRRMKNLVFYLMIKKMLDAEFVKCRNRRSF